GKPGAVEPTCYAAMAIQPSDVRGAVEWLRGRMREPSHVHTQWERSFALLAFERLKADASIREQAARELLNAPVRQPVETTTTVNELDGTLRGWSWIDNTFSWVEPTSYALLALKAHGIGTHSRVQEAERLLLDRVCADGGWN